MTSMGRFGIENIGLEPNIDKVLLGKEVNVVGAGVAGIFAALGLQKRGAKVRIYDPFVLPNSDISNTSTIAIGQFLAFVEGSDSNEAYLKTVEQIKKFSKRSEEIYTEMAKNPHKTGVMRVSNVELFSKEDPWPKYLLELTKPKEHPLDVPVTITDSDGEPKTYTHYYEFDTFSINTPKTLGYLRDEFFASGGEIVNEKVTLDTLSKMKEPVVNAAGTGAPELVSDANVDFIKGHTFIFKPEMPIPPIGISVADMIMMPREDGTFIVGALYKKEFHKDLPEEGEKDEILKRIKEITSLRMGKFQPLDQSLLEESPLVHSAGKRVVPERGVVVGADSQNPNVVDNYGYGGMGWSLAAGAAEDVAGEVIKIVKNKVE